jgi:hypothetical protein
MILLVLNLILIVGLSSSCDFDFMSERYLPLDNGIVLSLILLPSSGLIYALYLRFTHLITYTLYPDRLVLSQRFKPDRILYMSDLKSWWPSVSPGGRGRASKTTSIILVYPEQTITLSSLNIDVPESHLTRSHIDQLIEDTDATAAAKQKSNLIGVVVFVLLVGAMIFISSVDRLGDSVKGTELKNLSDLTLSKLPLLIKHSSRSAPSTYEMQLKTKELKGFTFVLKNIGLQKERNTIKEYMHTNDTVNITILQYDYDSKISGTREPSFWVKHFHWHTIKIKGLQSNVINL